MDQGGYEKKIIAGDYWGYGIALTLASFCLNKTDSAISVDLVVMIDLYPKVSHLAELFIDRRMRLSAMTSN